LNLSAIEFKENKEDHNIEFEVWDEDSFNKDDLIGMNNTNLFLFFC
jgi:hypothetical protein